MALRSFHVQRAEELEQMRMSEKGVREGEGERGRERESTSVMRESIMAMTFRLNYNSEEPFMRTRTKSVQHTN